MDPRGYQLIPGLHTVRHIPGTKNLKPAFDQFSKKYNQTSWASYDKCHLPSTDPILAGEIYCSLKTCRTPNEKLLSMSEALSQNPPLKNWYVGMHVDGQKLDLGNYFF